MIHLEGAEAFDITPERTFAVLANAGVLAGHLPDAIVTHAEPDRASWKVKPQLAFLAGELETTTVVLERMPGERV